MLALSNLWDTLGLPKRSAESSGLLLWQRGWHTLETIQALLCPSHYRPSPPSAFDPDMAQAIARLASAYAHQEKVAIWGDFDADGLTATAVLWEGLGQFFTPQTHLRYVIPNRFTESHGLSAAGLDALADWGCTLMVTCDTGSTAAAEIRYAQRLGIETIVTDHHTLPETRPPVVALINPRQLPQDHPLADLSGVAVAYKLLEALYAHLPEVPQQPLESLLDLVAIGLIADLVQLRGDCRYLAQIGLQTLENQAKQGFRPGLTKLLQLCKRTGDRPSDVAFGIGPRINAISRIHGDARFGVELLTSRDRAQAEKLALEAELANIRRKDLQRTVLEQATAQLSTVDLSTTQVIILTDPQWSPGVLGLVASQLAQTYGRPTILFQTETTPQPGKPLMARGSARSVQQIDLYELVQGQSQLLTSFGGHPYAAGLTLAVVNLPLFAEGINRAVRSHAAITHLTQTPCLEIDLPTTVDALGKDLFKALKLLEPYGMGNPVPRLLLSAVRVENVRDFALRDQRQGKQRYFKVEFEIQDPITQATFPGHWWGHRRDELPAGAYDLVIELDVNTYKKRYEARLIDRRSAPSEVPLATPASSPDWNVDPANPLSSPDAATMRTGLTDAPDFPAPEVLWQQWIGMVKYLARTGAVRSQQTIREKLGVGDRAFQIGIQELVSLGFTAILDGDALSITRQSASSSGDMPTQSMANSQTAYEHSAQQFMLAVQEEQFRRQYCQQLANANP